MKRVTLVLILLVAGSSMLLAQPAKILLLEPETENVQFSLACDVYSWIGESFSKYDDYLELVDLKQARDTLGVRNIYLSKCKTNDDYFEAGGILNIDKIVYTKVTSTDVQIIYATKVYDIKNKGVIFQKETTRNITYKNDIYELVSRASKEVASSVYNYSYDDYETMGRGTKLRDLSEIIGEKELKGIKKVKYKMMPALVNKETIIYPEDLKSQGIGGNVYIYVLVDEEGKASRIEPANSSGNGSLDTVAMNMVKQFLYSPGIGVDEKAHKAWAIIHMKFDLKNNKVYAVTGEFKEMEKTPKIVKKVAPVYPQEARRKGIQGKVVLYLLIGIDGKVKQIDVKESSGSASLDEAAREAASKFIFTPAIAPGGKPVRVWITYPVDFKLNSLIKYVD